MEWRCGEWLPQGRPCGKTFKRAWNLKRHVETQHSSGSTAGPGVIRVGSAGTQPEPEPSPATNDPGTGPSQPPCPYTPAGQPDRAGTLSPMLQHWRGAGRAVAGDSVEEEDAAEERAAKRQNIGRAVYRETMPAYNIKQSRKTPGQIRAAGWLTQAARERLEGHTARLLAQWGLPHDHRDTCVLLPASWEAASPASLSRLFSYDRCPRQSSQHMMYKEGDHATQLARAIAWFGGEWPRRGIDLDNFLECGPFQRVDGSHLCHNSLCIVPGHILLEPSEANQERLVCHDDARRLRLNGQDVPLGCSKHSPPCLMQLAALTTFERVLIQLWVLRRSLALSPALDEAPARPRWHKYATLECALPLRFCTTGPTLHHDALRRPAADFAHLKPELLCPFCASIKALGTIVGYWGHLVYKHQDVAPDRLAGEVRRTAAAWLAYWAAAAIAPRKDDQTALKLRQAVGDGFQWADALGWNLKPQAAGMPPAEAGDGGCSPE